MAAGTYFIEVVVKDGIEGGYVLEVDVGTLENPLDQINIFGGAVGGLVTEFDPVAMSVDASAQSELRFEWFVDGALFEGADTSSLQIIETLASDAGEYAVVIDSATDRVVVRGDLVVEPALTSAAVFGEVTSVVDTWEFVDWFGLFEGTDFPWVFHDPIGWVYVSTSSAASSTSFWAYVDDFGWVLFDENEFPYIYSPEFESWFYLEATPGDVPYVYDFATNRWIAFGE